MSVFERYILGLLYATEEHQLRRLSFPRGVGHDRGRSQHRQSFANEHVSAIHPLSAHTTWIRDMGLDCRRTREKENVRAQVQEHS